MTTLKIGSTVQLSHGGSGKYIIAAFLTEDQKLTVKQTEWVLLSDERDPLRQSMHHVSSVTLYIKKEGLPIETVASFFF